MNATKTIKTAERFDLNLEVIGYRSAKNALASKRARKLAFKKAARRAGQ